MMPATLLAGTLVTGMIEPIVVNSPAIIVSHAAGFAGEALVERQKKPSAISGVNRAALVTP
jgi:hypothetical protein